MVGSESCYRGGLVPHASLARLALACSLACSLACRRDPIEPSDSTPPTATPTCEGSDRLATRWTPERRDRVVAALAEQPGEWPRRLVDTLARRHASALPRWEASFTAACETRDEARQRCLERFTDEFDGLVLMLEQSPTHAAAIAPWAEAQLHGLELCDTPPVPFAGHLAPELGAQLSATSFAFSLNDLRGAGERYQQLIEQPSLVDDPVYAFTLETMAGVLELAFGNPESATQRFESLSTKLDRVGPRERASYEYLAGMLRVHAGDRPGATTAFERMVADEREYGEALRLALALESVAAVRQQAMADTPGAIAALTEAIGIYTRVLGSESAHVAQAQIALSDVQVAAGRFDLAQDLLLQARDGFSAALGSDHPATSEVVLRLGRLMLAAGRPGDAYHAFLDLLEIRADQFGERAVEVAEAKLELGEALRAMGEHDSARVVLLEALPILVELRGTSHRSVAQTSIHLGQALVEVAEVAKDHELLDEAEGHCTRGRALASALPEADPLRSDAERCLVDLASARKAAGKRKKSKPKPP